MKITAKTQAAVIKFAADRGNGPRDFRDAVHEIVHKLQLEERLGVELEDMDRNTIGEAYDYDVTQPGEKFRDEIVARATEWLACDSAGIEYDLESWAAIAAMESIKNGFSTTLKNWTDIIKTNHESSTAKKMLARVLKLVKESS
jgi:hypothetical protein